MTNLLQRAMATKNKYGLGETLLQTYNWATLNHLPHKTVWYWLNRMTCDGFVTKEIQGSKMLLNLKDRGANCDLFLDGIREEKCTQYFQSIMKPDWTIIEAGAHIGYYALQEAQQVSHVYAIEPDPKNIEALGNNIHINGYQNVTIFNMAVGDHDGIMPFCKAEFSNLHRIGRDSDKNTIPMQMMTVDSFVKKQKISKVDFVRMDVEGYELKILQGMIETIRNNKLGLFIEVHRDLLEDYGDSLDKLLTFLEIYGFQIIKTIFTPEFKDLDYSGYPFGFTQNSSIKSVIHKPLASAFWFFAEKV